MVKSLALAFLLTICPFSTLLAQTDCAAGESCFPQTGEEFQALTRAELNTLFESGDGTRLPSGKMSGKGLAYPGTFMGRLMGNIVSAIIWNGKVFRPELGEIYNLMGPFGSEAIRGELGIGTGLDGRMSIIVDYPDSSLGDEIRWVGGNSYLGRGTDEGEYGVYFCLIAEDSTSASKAPPPAAD